MLSSVEYYHEAGEDEEPIAIEISSDGGNTVCVAFKYLGDQPETASFYFSNSKDANAILGLLADTCNAIGRFIRELGWEND